jgi:sirohydrochlorin ferrochelatase
MRMNILLAHGSPDPRHRTQAEALAARVSEELGDAVQAAFLDDVDIPRAARVLPLFLGEGRHAMDDAAHFAARFDASLLPPLASVSGRLADLGVSMAESLSAPREPVIFAYYRFRHFERLVAGVYARRKRLPKMSMAALHGSPDCTDVLRFWMGQGVKRVAVQPMLLFAGRSLQGLVDAAGAWPVAMGRPLAEHAGMPALVADCLRGAA